MLKRAFAAGWAVLFAAAQGCTAGGAAAADPTGGWHYDAEAGLLWKFSGSATPLEYVFQPDFVSIVGPAHFRQPFAGGELVLRPRFTLMLEPIVHGPEHHYYAGSASGLLEWWSASRSRALFLSSGGGFGWLDARGYNIPGAQGMRFNLNWFIYSGARLRLGDSCTASAGIYFQHVSNGHFDKVDPGVNAIGPLLSARFGF